MAAIINKLHTNSMWINMLNDLRFIYLPVIALTLCLSCQDNDKKLPILGEKEIIANKNSNAADTIDHTIPDFNFLDQDSTIITNETFKDKIYVADFFFTSCPTICPVMKTQMIRVYEKFKDNKSVLFLSHTIDPTYDTIQLLKDYSERLGAKSEKWHFVTGEKDKIYEVGLKGYMVTAQEDKTAAGGFLHSGAFILVDNKRRVRGMYDGTKKETVDQLISDIEVLLKEIGTPE